MRGAVKAKGVPKEMTFNDDKIDQHTREFQWRHWHAEDDLWAKMGDVISSEM